MGVVTNIKPSKKTNGYHVYVDGGYSFTVSDLEFSAHEITVGQDLTTAEIARYQKNHLESKAYTRALRYIGVRPRSVRETTDYLLRVNAQGADEAIERLIAAGLLNDLAFAQVWIRDRQAMKPKSRRVLVQELRQKGVESSAIDEALSEVDPDDQIRAIEKVIEKKRRLSRFETKEKLIRYLLGQGFEYDLVKQATMSLENED